MKWIIGIFLLIMAYARLLSILGAGGRADEKIEELYAKHLKGEQNARETHIDL